eukprot:SAG25_NODE_107_length_15283_cov_3.516728_14_plen_179_part_00
MDTSRICILARRHRACAQVTPANSGTCVASRTWYRSPPNGVNPCVGAVASSGHRSNVPQHPRPQCGAAALPQPQALLPTRVRPVGIVPLVQLYGVQRGRHSEPAQITVSDIFVRTYGRPRASIDMRILLLCDSRHLAVSAHAASWIDQQDTAPHYWESRIDRCTPMWLSGPGGPAGAL